MDTNCEHLKANPNFLLDDENCLVQHCILCGEDVEQYSSPQWNVNNSAYTTKLNGMAILSDMDEHMDTLEDSPLLINDCDQPNDDFHCHSVLTLGEDKRAWKKLLIASALCFLFMITELIGGFIAGSLAIMTDAAHLFSDFIGFQISLLSMWFARKAPSKSMTFGYHRAEVIGAFLSVLTIWLLAAVFAILAINRLWKKAYDIDADTMMLVAVLGLVVNIVMGAVLYGCHNHSHGLHKPDESNTNINVRAATAHVLGDLLQSFGVLVAAIIIKIFPNAKLADPICTLIFSVIVFCTTAKVAKDSMWLLLEGCPKNTGDLAFELQNIANVRHLHNLHIWTLSPGKDAMSVHLCVDKYCDRDTILEKATALIKNKLNVISCTIQIEIYNTEVINNCKYCQSVPC